METEKGRAFALPFFFVRNPCGKLIALYYTYFPII